MATGGLGVIGGDLGAIASAILPKQPTLRENDWPICSSGGWGPGLQLALPPFHRPILTIVALYLNQAWVSQSDVTMWRIPPLTWDRLFFWGWAAENFPPTTRDARQVMLLTVAPLTWRDHTETSVPMQSR